MRKSLARSVSRRLWDLERCGCTPQKMAARVLNKTEPRICVISVPKAGTHLAERALILHPRLYRLMVPTLHSQNLERFGGLPSVIKRMRPGSVVVTHLHYSGSNYEVLKQSEVKVIVVIRDFRDVLVSRAFYVVRNRRHPYHQYAKELSLEVRFLGAIVGDPRRGVPSLRDTLHWFVGWLNRDFSVIRFENLVNQRTRMAVLQELFG